MLGHEFRGTGYLMFRLAAGCMRQQQQAVHLSLPPAVLSFWKPMISTRQLSGRCPGLAISMNSLEGTDEEYLKLSHHSDNGSLL